MPKCAFCTQAAKLSGEHLWSAWMGRILGQSRYAFRQRDAQGNIAKQWKSTGLDLTANAVCESCNNGWMSKLENRTKDVAADMILNGSGVVLDAKQIQIILQFAFKNAVIADNTAKGRNPFFTTSARRNFAQSLTIPEGVQVWLACFRDPHGHSGFFLSRYITAKGRLNQANGFELYVFTYTAGRLALQVVVSRWTNPLLISRYATPNVTQGTGWDEFSIPVWPDTGSSVKWPPTKSFINQGDIYQFCERWGHIGISWAAAAELGI